MANQLQYQGITPENFDALKAKLKQMGLHLDGHQGNFNEKGVSGTYTYNSDAETLEIAELNVGFPASMMLSADTLQQRMTDMIKQCGGQQTA